MSKAENSQEDETRVILLSEAAELYGFSQPYLAELARNGRLQAWKMGKFWVTTPASLEAFIKSRQRKGVFRDDISVED